MGIWLWRKNPRPADALTVLPVLRPTDFYYTDFVNEGALTHGGMFSLDVSGVFNGHSSAYARELFDLVDRWREAYRIGIDDLPAKVESMVSNYMAARKDVLMAKKSSTFIVGDGEELAAETHQETSDSRHEIRDTRHGEETGVMATEGKDRLGEVERLVNELVAGSEQAQAQRGQVEQIQQLQEQLTAQGEQIETLHERVEKVTDLLTRSLQSMAAMQRNLLRLDGEQVVRVPVQMSGNLNPLEALHPIPTLPPTAPKGKATLTAEERAIQIQQQKAARMTG